MRVCVCVCVCVCVYMCACVCVCVCVCVPSPLLSSSHARCVLGLRRPASAAVSAGSVIEILTYTCKYFGYSCFFFPSSLLCACLLFILVVCLLLLFSFVFFQSIFLFMFLLKMIMGIFVQFDLLLLHDGVRSLT